MQMYGCHCDWFAWYYVSKSLELLSNLTYIVFLIFNPNPHVVGVQP